MTNVKTRYRGKWLMIAVVLAVFCFGTVTAHADVLNADETGSVSVTMQDSDGTAVGGGTLALYKVADILVDEAGNPYYSYTDAFSGCDVSLDGLTDSSLADMAEAYSEYVDGNGIRADTSVKVGSDGTASFVNLSTGIYLVIQREAADGYYAVSPFVVTVPVEINGEYVYNVDAAPKMETVTPVPEEPETPETPPEPTGSLLPQTGFILWPMVMLAACGAALIIIGWNLAFKRKVRSRV